MFNEQVPETAKLWSLRNEDTAPFSQGVHGIVREANLYLAGALPEKWKWLRRWHSHADSNLLLSSSHYFHMEKLGPPPGNGKAAIWVRSGAGLVSAASLSWTWGEPPIVEAAFFNSAVEITPATGCELPMRECSVNSEQ